MKKKLKVMAAGAVVAALSMTGCYRPPEGRVRDHRIRQEGVQTIYELRVMRPVSHDTDAHFWVSVGRVEYYRCDYDEQWVDENVGGCDARVRDNPDWWGW